MNVIFKGLAAALLSVLCAGASLAQDEGVNQPQPEIQAIPSESTQEVRQQPVLQIVVEGNERVEADTILSYLLIQPGDLPNSRLINLSIQTLYSTNLFSDVRVAIDGSSMVLYVEHSANPPQLHPSFAPDVVPLLYYTELFDQPSVMPQLLARSLASACILLVMVSCQGFTINPWAVTKN